MTTVSRYERIRAMLPILILFNNSLTASLKIYTRHSGKRHVTRIKELEVVAKAIWRKENPQILTIRVPIHV